MVMLEISKFLRGIHNEYTVSDFKDIHYYSVGPKESNQPKDIVFSTIYQFVLENKIFPVYFHLKTKVPVIRDLQLHLIETLVVNKNKEFYYRIKVGSLNELKKYLSETFWYAMDGQVFITIEKQLRFLEDKKRDDGTFLTLLNFGVIENFYIWIGYDGVDWELLTNKEQYSLNNLKENDYFIKGVQFHIDEENYQYEIVDYPH